MLHNTARNREYTDFFHVLLPTGLHTLYIFSEKKQLNLVGYDAVLSGNQFSAFGRKLCLRLQDSQEGVFLRTDFGLHKDY